MVFWKLRGSAFVVLVAVSVSVSAELLLSNSVRAESPAASGTSALQTAKPKKSPELLRQEIAELTKKIEAEPKVAKNYGRRGLRYKELGEYTLALRDFDSAIVLDPSDGRVCGFKGEVFWELGKINEAIKQFSAAIEKGPESAQTHVQRSVCYQKVHDLPRALSDAARAAQMDRNDPHVWRQLGFVQLRSADFRSAKASYTKAIALDPNDGESYYFRSEANASLKCEKQATEDSAKARQLGFLIEQFSR